MSQMHLDLETRLEIPFISVPSILGFKIVQSLSASLIEVSSFLYIVLEQAAKGEFSLIHTPMFFAEFAVFLVD